MSKILKQSKNNLSELINKYIDPDVESQLLESQMIESGIDSHLKNWELEINNLEKDLPKQMLSDMRKILQDNQKNNKRSKSVQSSFKYGMDNQSMKQSKESKQNTLSHSINKKQSTTLNEQKSFKEVGIPYKQQETYDKQIKEQSLKKNMQRAQSAQEVRGSNSNYCYKIFPEWNIYTNVSKQFQSKMSHRELKYDVNQRLINDENDLNNSQQKQSLRNSIQRSQSAAQLKESYINNMVQLNDITIDQSHLIQTKPSLNIRNNQNLIEQKSLSQQSQMLEYIQNSDNFQKPQYVKSVNEILQIPANQIQQGENIKSRYNILNCLEKRQQGTQNYFLNYNKNHMGQLNRSSINKTNISQQYPQKYQIIMQSLQKPHAIQMHKSQFNQSNQEINSSSPSQMISSYKNIHYTQRDSSQRSRKKIFDEYSATSYIQNVKDSYNRIFPRKN
ncbi:hypothetical protein TTHERM_000495899 (macronuclear) [Tetrahymena thermophila SB210]|uniref:Uncharacterized protein n=1 Tax=Tetrahymena thermophila (strain SB210) TaxID=312017 RepID=W7XDS5_TETTS|nr:hypothetical protein TTHERM_000495899 [Tetrahymena thermophila SB210]EWS70939.1 hypothetical protein TTHERM_000495899 [Tetrahymena thermophila SB210]|eukprot:XP_012656495.1 hypothetical protein TTHERM_000495899 [Tetrahymena thermophila SB210]